MHNSDLSRQVSQMANLSVIQDTYGCYRFARRLSFG